MKLAPLLFAALVAQQSFAQDFSADTLFQEVENQHITSVNGLLDYLPDWLKQRLVLVYQSRSLQKANPQHPRMIFFGKDEGTLLAISGEPTDPLYHTVEMIRFEPQAAEFQFYDIKFDPAGKNKGVVQRETQFCQKCHGKDPHPIWDVYAHWPGAYGNSVGAYSPETDAFVRFLESTKDDTRYARLFKDPYARLFEHNNALMTVRVNGWNADRIVNRLKKSPAYLKYRDALMATWFDEWRWFVPAPGNIEAEYSEVLKNTLTSIDRYYEDIDRRDALALGQTRNPNFDVGFAPRFAAFRTLCNRMGVDTSEFASILGSNMYVFTDATESLIYEVALKLGVEIAVDEPQLAGYFKVLPRNYYDDDTREDYSGSYIAADFNYWARDGLNKLHEIRASGSDHQFVKTGSQ